MQLPEARPSAEQVVEYLESTKREFSTANQSTELNVALLDAIRSNDNYQVQHLLSQFDPEEVLPFDGRPILLSQLVVLELMSLVSGGAFVYSLCHIYVLSAC